MSTNGIKTSFWGPPAWAFLFSTIMGAYPVRVDPSNKEHAKTVKSFQGMFASLKQTLPCSFCRQSYTVFLREIPIAKYMHSRREMLKWLYLIRDRVNRKLMAQEEECFQRERVKLLAKRSSTEQRRAELKKLKDEILKTKPSPPFDKIVAMYEKQRAGCKAASKRC